MKGVSSIDEVAGDDDDEWIDLEPKKGPAARILPLATVSVAPMGAASSVFRAMIFLRREAGEWIEKNGPRFKIQVGGADCNKIRIVPDQMQGRFEAGTLKGTRRLILGVVNVWPAERRERVEAEVSISDAFLMLTLPRDFAKATAQSKTDSTAKQTAPVAKPAAPPAPPAPSSGAHAMAAFARNRAVVPATGDPAPGRSALDQRKGR